MKLLLTICFFIMTGTAFAGSSNQLTDLKENKIQKFSASMSEGSSENLFVCHHFEGGLSFDASLASEGQNHFLFVIKTVRHPEMKFHSLQAEWSDDANKVKFYRESGDGLANDFELNLDLNSDILGPHYGTVTLSRTSQPLKITCHREIAHSFHSELFE